MRIITTLQVITAALTLSLTASTNAQQPTGFVTFTIDKILSETAGTWTVTGAVDDHGPCCVEPPHFARGVSGVVRTIDELTGQDGTITWQLDAMFNGRALGNHVVALTGSWRIIGGTGAYAGATGQGKVGGTYNQATEEMHAVNTGVITLVPDALTFRTMKD